jgi:CheY-like chemotaxis protein
MTNAFAGAQPAAEAAAGRVGTARTAVIADPDPVSRRLRAESLLSIGLEVSEASDGKAVVALADAGRLDIAILCLFMPEMDGIETVRYLHRRHPSVRTVVLVNNSHPAFLELGRVATLLGAHVVLYEPFTNGRLTQATARLMVRRRRS